MKKLMIVAAIFASILLNTAAAGARPVDPETGKPQEPKKPAPGMPDCIAPNDKGECVQHGVKFNFLATATATATATDEDEVGCSTESDIEDLLKCLDKKNGMGV